MAIFRFFKMAAAAILNFSNLKFLTVGRLKRAELHRRDLVEIGQTAAEIWLFLDFSKMMAICHLGFVVCVWTTHEGHLVVFIAVQNLVGIDAVVLIICMFFDFSSLAWKRLFTPPKLGFLGTASFEPSCAKIHRRI